MDEELVISREKLFNLLSKGFTDIYNASIKLLETNDAKDFQTSIEVIIDDLNHDILEKCKREKPIIPEKNGSKIEVEWS